MENTYVKKASIEFEDGTIKELEGFVMIITQDDTNSKWDVQVSEEVEIDRILDFAYDTVDAIEGDRVFAEESAFGTKKSHLRLVKG